MPLVASPHRSVRVCDTRTNDHSGRKILIQRLARKDLVLFDEFLDVQEVPMFAIKYRCLMMGCTCSPSRSPFLFLLSHTHTQIQR